MKLDEVNKKYAGEWVVAKVLKMEKGQPEELEVVFHSKKRAEAYKKQMEFNEIIAVFYAGEVEEEGYAVAFLWLDMIFEKIKG